MHYAKDFKHVWFDLWINWYSIGFGFVYAYGHLSVYLGPFIFDVQVI
jgi:hypothetical protein